MAGELAKVSLTLYRGERKAWTFTLKDADNAVRSDLDGKAVSLTLRTTSVEPDPPALQVSGSAVSTGQTTVTVTRTQSLTLAAGDYALSVMCTTSGSEEELGIGTLRVLNGVYDEAAS